MVYVSVIPGPADNNKYYYIVVQSPGSSTPKMVNKPPKAAASKVIWLGLALIFGWKSADLLLIDE